MPKPIISNLKEKLKLLRTILTLPRFWGPLFTVLFTAAYHVAAVEFDQFDFTVAVGWLWLILVFGVFVGGLRAGLICAVWIALYVHYALPGDLVLTAQRIAIGFMMAALVGWQTHKLREFYKAADELLNGNAVRLNEALVALRYSKSKLAEARKLIEQSEDGFGNVLARVVGYSQLKRTIKEVDEWYENPENVKRLQAMDKLKGQGDG